MLRLLLPPNLAAAAPRDAVALKVELTPGADPAPEILPALALLQRWVGPAAQPPFFLQLTRAQLRELLAALRGQPVFAQRARCGTGRSAAEDRDAGFRQAMINLPQHRRFPDAGGTAKMRSQGVESVLAISTFLPRPSKNRCIPYATPSRERVRPANCQATSW